MSQPLFFMGCPRNSSFPIQHGWGIIFMDHRSLPRANEAELYVSQMDCLDAEVQGYIPCIEKGRLGSRSDAGEPVSREEAAEVERDILQVVICHPGT